MTTTSKQIQYLFYEKQLFLRDEQVQSNTCKVSREEINLLLKRGTQCNILVLRSHFVPEADQDGSQDSIYHEDGYCLLEMVADHGVVSPVSEKILKQETQSNTYQVRITVCSSNIVQKHCDPLCTHHSQT